MPVDPEYLRQHFASLSDEALLEIDRAELVEAAQSCYDVELRRRKLLTPRAAKPADTSDEQPHVDVQPDRTDEKPEWLAEASEVFSRAEYSSNAPAPDVADARDALERAGIPCYVEQLEAPEPSTPSRQPTHIWRVLVPGDFNLHAASVLDRDIFNKEFEDEWTAHLQTLSEQELRQMNPQTVFCGLFDRVERVTRVYEQEIARRNSQTESA